VNKRGRRKEARQARKEARHERQGKAAEEMKARQGGGGGYEGKA
jgi:hypothetical protein